MILLAFLAGLAALGFGAWLRERVARDAERVALLEWEVKSLREEVRKISAPSQAAPAASSPADASPGAASGISSKGEYGTEQAAAARASGVAEQAAPPVAFPIPPVAFAPPHIPPSKQITDAAASARASRRQPLRCEREQKIPRFLRPRLRRLRRRAPRSTGRASSA